MMFRLIDDSTQMGSIADDMDIETFLRETDLTPRLSTESIDTTPHDFQLDPDNMVIDRQPINNPRELARQCSQREQQREQQRIRHPELRRLQERRIPPWQRRLQHAARLENMTTTVPTWLSRHRYLYAETKNEHSVDEMSCDAIQQSSPDLVDGFYELDQLDPRKRWEQEEIDALQRIAALEALLIMEHQEQQQRMNTDVDMDSETE